MTETRERKPSRRATRLWKRLGQAYGTRLADQYGPTPPLDWCALIDRTDDPRLERALIIVRREFPSYPPTLGEFEKSIPPKDPVGRVDSAFDQLSQHAAKALRLCAHQSQRPWTYVGHAREYVDARGRTVTIPTPTGVVIAACDCPQGNSGYKVNLRDIQ